MHQMDWDVRVLEELVALQVDSGIMKHSGYSIDQLDIQSKYSGPEHPDAPRDHMRQDLANFDLIFRLFYRLMYIDCSFDWRWRTGVRCPHNLRDAGIS